VAFVTPSSTDLITTILTFIAIIVSRTYKEPWAKKIQVSMTSRVCLDRWELSFKTFVSFFLQLWLDPSAPWNFVRERTPWQNFSTVLMIIAPSIAVTSLRWHAWS